MFEKLKKIPEKNFNKKIEKLFFMLDFSEKGAFIDVVDEEGRSLENVDSAQYDKNTKEILKNIETIKEHNFFYISWDNEGEKIYLEEYPYLLNLLEESKYFINHKFEKIEVIEEEKELSLKIEKTEDKLESKLLLDYEIENFNFITENRVIAGKNLYRIQDIGENFYTADELNSKFKIDELEKFLTIAYSCFDNFTIDYNGYQVEKDIEKELMPELTIEKISRDKSLYLKVGFSISTLNYESLKDYDIKTAVIVSEMEEKISICNINLQSIGKALDEIIKLLVKNQRKLKIRDSYYVEGNTLILEEELAKEFVTKELLTLVNKYKIIGTDKLKRYKIRHVKPKLVANLAHNIDFLEGDAFLEIEGEKYSIFDILNSYKKDSYILLSDGTSALINQQYIEKLERLFKEEDEEGKVKVSFFDMPLIENLIEDKVESSVFRSSKEFYRGLNSLKEADVTPPMIKATLREYQDYGYRWLYYLIENQLGGCLADDMGLGKTLQTISILSYIHAGRKKKPSIVIMPKSLVFNWENEIQKFAPQLRVKIYYGNNRDFTGFDKSDIILTTYGTVRNDIKSLKELEFETVILDESQNIKNINSQITKAVMLLKSRNRLALSGTPVENNLGELYSLFRFLNPKMLGTIDEFNRFYANPIQKDNDREVIEELKKKIYPFILRRLKKEVLKDLPDKIEKTLFIEMNAAQKRLYEERRAFYYTLVNEKIKAQGIGKTQVFILQALNELRQIASCPENQTDGDVSSTKREILMENVVEAVRNGHKVLVFTNFISSIENICSDLDENEIKYVSMTGATKDRQKLVEKFQNDKKCKVFVMTLKTGGVGLNLTAADKIFIYDPWWNKTAEDQAIDRSHRMGQDRTVFSYKLIAKGTIEEKMLALQKQKSQLFEDLVSSDSASMKSLTETDIEFILGE